VRHLYHPAPLPAAGGISTCPTSVSKLLRSLYLPFPKPITTTCSGLHVHPIDNSSLQRPTFSLGPGPLAQAGAVGVQECMALHVQVSIEGGAYEGLNRLALREMLLIRGCCLVLCGMLLIEAHASRLVH
jgi:hypothetical protein